MKKGPLSLKALAAAAPADQKPYELTRKYGEPKLFADLAGARAQLLSDLDDCYDTAKRIGSIHDRTRISTARKGVVGMAELPEGRFELSVEVDEYTGTKYQAVLRDRRTGA